MQTISLSRPVALDPSRIAAISGAMAVHAFVLLLLLAPMAPPVAKLVRDMAPTITYVTVKREPPPPPPRPIPVEVRRATTPTPRSSPAPVQVQTSQPPVDAAPAPDDYAVVAAVEPVELVSPPPADTGQPLAGAHLEYASAPAPTYPRDSLLNNESGTVMLEVLVDVDGRPLDVKIARSSGHRQLDLAAKRQVLSKWRFRPAMRNGQAMQAIGLVPVEFALH